MRAAREEAAGAIQAQRGDGVRSFLQPHFTDERLRPREVKS